MKIYRSHYSGYRFPEIISYAIWTYHRFCLSFRDVELSKNSKLPTPPYSNDSGVRPNAFCVR
jgi:hypothetical protein